MNANSTNAHTEPGSPFRVRPIFLLGCGVSLAVVILPEAFSGDRFLQLVLLGVATITVILGWLLLLIYPERNESWRSVISLITFLYLTLSIPVFLFESSQIKWIARHHSVSVYVRPWVHWGHILVLGSIVGSFFGRGRARIAFVVGATLLAIIRLSMGVWVY
jgi:hypothetical protein